MYVSLCVCERVHGVVVKFSHLSSLEIHSKGILLISSLSWNRMSFFLMEIFHSVCISLGLREMLIQWNRFPGKSHSFWMGLTWTCWKQHKSLAANEIQLIIQCFSFKTILENFIGFLSMMTWWPYFNDENSVEVDVDISLLLRNKTSFVIWFTTRLP